MAAPSPTFSSLLPGPVNVGGVGAAVDVAVGLQAVLRRSDHVGGFHRRPAGEEFCFDRERESRVTRSGRGSAPVTTLTA